MSETPDEVTAEFFDRFNTSVVTLALAQSGLTKLCDEFAAVPVRAENPDPRIWVGPGDPNDPATRALGAVRRSQLLEEAQREGQAHVRMAQQWLVAFFADWEEDLRPRLAAARGEPVKNVRVPALGDIRHMRNDIVHHRGIATAHNTGRCEVLRWFAAGDVIAITHHHLLELREALGVPPLQPGPPPA